MESRISAIQGCVNVLILVLLTLFVFVPATSGVLVQVWLPVLGSPGNPAYQEFESPDIMFGTNTNWNWPYWDWSTALLTGVFNVGSDSNYTFALNSDDGSRLFIDGALAVDSWWDKPPYNVYGTVFLTAGLHPFKIDYYQRRGGSGLDLYLPTGVTYHNAIPEPATMMLFGLGGILVRSKINRKK